ncbi:MAG: hypothetical protein KAR32_00015, partial [Candidatus Omnitrophica bacterium]|nr:hypothetical protein [Candidatus Omnitrophota bacterium]
DTPYVFLAPYYQAENIRDAVDVLFRYGKKTAVDLYAWRSPEILDGGNYRLFCHEPVTTTQAQEPDESVLNRLGHDGVVLHLDEGRRVYVRLRAQSSDQLWPDFRAKYWDQQTQKPEFFWENFFFGLGREWIRDYGVTVFRVDRGDEHRNEAIFNAYLRLAEYALREHGRKIYFLPEMYGREDRDEYRRRAVEFRNKLQVRASENGFAPAASQGLGEYHMFKSYFKDIPDGFFGRDKKLMGADRNFDNFMAALSWAFRSLSTKLVFFWTYDDQAARDTVPNEAVRRQLIAIELLWAKAFFNVFFDYRDLVEFCGELWPIAGGNRDERTGEYFDHKFATEEELKRILTHSLTGIFKDSYAGRFLEGIRGRSVREVRLSLPDHRMSFEFKQGEPAVFDLKEISENTASSPVCVREKIEKGAQPSVPLLITGLCSITLILWLAAGAVSWWAAGLLLRGYPGNSLFSDVASAGWGNGFAGNLDPVRMVCFAMIGATLRITFDKNDKGYRASQRGREKQFEFLNDIASSLREQLKAEISEIIWLREALDKTGCMMTRLRKNEQRLSSAETTGFENTVRSILLKICKTNVPEKKRACDDLKIFLSQISLSQDVLYPGKQEILQNAREVLGAARDSLQERLATVTSMVSHTKEHLFAEVREVAGRRNREIINRAQKIIDDLDKGDYKTALEKICGFMKCQRITHYFREPPFVDTHHLLGASYSALKRAGRRYDKHEEAEVQRAKWLMDIVRNKGRDANLLND